MRIVVSGTHAVGKSTLVSDFAMSHPQFQVLTDHFDLVDVPDHASAASFRDQLAVAAERLLMLEVGADVIAEREPLDFIADLEASVRRGLTTVFGPVWEALRATTTAAMAHVDHLVVLPLTGAQSIWVPDEEDPQLRTAMDEQLLDLCNDEEVVGGVGSVVELTGPLEDRLIHLAEWLNLT
ncbi:MAG: hypothetical protein ABIU87_09050 [Ornithinibacter sp.]